MQISARGRRRGKPAPRNANEEWVCGRLKYGAVCSSGPDGEGKCHSTYDCTPQKTSSGWLCRRPAAFGGKCRKGPRPDGQCCKPFSPCRPQRNLRARQNRVAYAVAALTGLCLLAAFVFGNGTQFLMPGPLASAHGAIEDCGACHTETGAGKLSWLHGFIVGNPRGDADACLSCHKMPSTAFNPHSATPEQLRLSTRNLEKIAAKPPASFSARVQKSVFPMNEVMAGGLPCATCHQEHQGIAFNLNEISNSQCQSCHTVEFDSFDGNHPDFSQFPFNRRTRITFDHQGHFGKHYPEVAKKNDASRPIPDTCSHCHTSKSDRRQMAVVPFAQTCATCHLDQIIGKERATGPKGIAFLSLPGVDLETLKAKNAPIGEWPELSEAEITPFMKVLIGRNDQGKALIKTVSNLDLLDLTQASDDQIGAVTKLIWEIKGLFYALVSGKASDVMATLDAGGRSQEIIANLTASISRDVITSAQRDWLPGLGAEMEKRTEAGGGESESWTSSITESRLAGSVAPEQLAGQTQALRLAQGWQVDAYGRLVKSGETLPPPTGTQPAPGEEAAPSDSGEAANAAEDAAPQDAAPADGADPGAADAVDSVDAAPEAVPAAAPIEPTIDAESWAEYGGWYRQDYAIFYRPVGHKDRFIHAWLDLTGPRAPRGDTGAPALVFDKLTAKDAQGQCTKCHSVDDIRGRGRKVNWGPASIATKYGRFTNFVHEPHFGVLENRGRLTCHSLAKGGQYLKSYEGGNPRNFVSNFSPVKKDLCQTCHTQSLARQDCLLCHKYHVGGVITPIMTTKIPQQ
jgi:hypothetical protein